MNVAHTGTGCMEVRRVAISLGRMRIEVHVAESAPLNTTPEIAKRAIAAFPDLPDHSCINPEGPAFGDIIDHTSLPHLLEHLIIARQAQLMSRSAATSTPDITLVGTTELAGDRDAIVEVSFADDMLAVASLRDSLDLLDEIVR